MHNDAQTHDGSNEQGNPNAASSAEEQGSASAQSQTNKTSQAEVQDNFSRVHLSVDQKWLDTTQEQALEPELEIIDAHHHLWDTPRPRYLIDEYLADVHSGHNVVASVFVECRAMYATQRAAKWQSLGETQFAAGAGAMFDSGNYGLPGLVSAIVGYVDLALGQDAQEILEKHIEVSAGRLKGVRNITSWHADPNVSSTSVEYNPDLFKSQSFQQGLKILGELGLSFDAFMFHTQLPDLVHLLEKNDSTTVVLNHFGGPVGVGPFADQRDEVFKDWAARIAELSKFDNLYLKLGGLGMRVNGFGFHEQERAPTSDQLVRAWQPYFDTALEHFGPHRCMFESNFPVDKGYCSYGVLWNAFKKLSATYTKAERDALFKKTAAQVYQIDI